MAFYRDVLEFRVIKETPGETVVFDFIEFELAVEGGPRPGSLSDLSAPMAQS